MSYSTVSDGPVTAYFLGQVGQVGKPAGRNDPAGQAAQAKKVAGIFADFIQAAKYNLHIAIYDFRLTGEADSLVIDAINKSAESGVVVRIAYNKPAKEKTTAEFAMAGVDPAPATTDEFVRRRLHPAVKLKAIRETAASGAGGTDTIGRVKPPAEKEPIEHPSHIMHNKYIIRDAMMPESTVLMGSANFTDDAWGLQENNILVFENAPELGRFYENDFSELWSAGAIANTGRDDVGNTTLGGIPVSVGFAPGRGRVITQDIASIMGTAKRRLLVASMVISSGAVLGTIADRMHRLPQSAAGVLFDRTEMNNAVVHRWQKSNNPASQALLQMWNAIAPRFYGKDSVAYTPNGPHNFMHNKFAVVDDMVITGSFNVSTAAEGNAENVVFINNAKLSDAYAQYFDDLIRIYSNKGP
jgi:phosphatidylserine/phosphatidylglycerophosphate/cardiolipin synthase-like enzyme